MPKNRAFFLNPIPCYSVRGFLVQSLYIKRYSKRTLILSVIKKVNQSNVIRINVRAKHFLFWGKKRNQIFKNILNRNKYEHKYFNQSKREKKI